MSGQNNKLNNINCRPKSVPFGSPLPLQLKKGAVGLPRLARDLAQWILDDKLPVRFQLQLHKLLWNDESGR